MAIGTPSLWATLSSGTDASSYSSSSVQAVANRFYLVGVFSRQSAATAATPTLAGGGITTWTQAATQLNSASQARITVFHALEASPGAAAALVADFGGTTQQRCVIMGLEWDGMDTSGTNGAGALAQAMVSSGPGGTGTSLSLTLGGSPGAGNATGGFFFNLISCTPTEGSGFTILGSAEPESNRAAHEYNLSPSGTTIDMSWNVAGSRIGIGYEIKAAAAGTAFPAAYYFNMMAG